MARMRRCRAQLNIRGSWGEEHLQPGMQVDLDRELAPGFTVADAVRGREDAFDPEPEEEIVAAVDTSLLDDFAPPVVPAEE